MLNKIRETLSIAIFVSLAAQISFNFITGGFIIALSVVVMAIFIYCYENLSPTYIAFCSGIFSPLIRLFFMLLSGEVDWSHASNMALPDMVFFFSYGTFYPLIYFAIIKQPKNLRNFPYAIFMCEILSNICELISRSYLVGENLLVPRTIAYLVVIAIIRTAFIQTILVAMDTYSSYLLKRETDEEYKRLMAMAALVESEIYIMKKCTGAIEGIMKKAFDSYKTLNKLEVPDELVKTALDVSQQAHEIKGDFMGIVKSLEGHLVDDYDGDPLPIKEIINIERKAVLSEWNTDGKTIEIASRIKKDFYVKEYFKIMSIIRNLLVNAIEANDKEICKIYITTDEEDDNYTIAVRDNGTGMDEDTVNTIFLAGFSTKFSPKTGSVQRGIGLSLVKEYVEEAFKGNIKIESQKGRWTNFLLTMPKERLEGKTHDEVLHS